MQPFTITQEQALLLIDAFEIESYFGNPEERDAIIENNPELDAAYEALYCYAHGLCELPEFL